MPSRIAPADWEAWARSFEEITDRILEVMNEAQPHLIKLESGYLRTGPTTTNAQTSPYSHVRPHAVCTDVQSRAPPRYEGHIGLIALNSTVEDRRSTGG